MVDIVNQIPNNIVYGLLCPISGELRYIGLTTKGFRRYKDHIKSMYRKVNKNIRLYKWMRLLDRRKLKPIFWIIEESNDIDDLKRKEIENIEYFKFVGSSLLNGTRGGDGIFGHKHSEESRQKMRNARLGVPLTEEAKRKLSTVHKNNPNKGTFKKGNVLSKETLEKLRLAKMGHPVSPETREKISKANKYKRLNGLVKPYKVWNKGIPMSEEAKAKRAITNAKKKLVEQTEEKE